MHTPAPPSSRNKPPLAPLPHTCPAVPHSLNIQVPPVQQRVGAGSHAVGVRLPQPGRALAHLHAAKRVGAAVALQRTGQGPPAARRC